VPDVLREYVVRGALPSPGAIQDAALVPTLPLTGAVQHLRLAAAATAARRDEGGGAVGSSGEGAVGVAS
jgi:hypothetical protein